MSMWSAAAGGQSTPQFDTLRQQAVRFSKQNAEAAFAMAEKLAQANDLQQLMTLQTQFIQEQLRNFLCKPRSSVA